MNEYIINTLKVSSPRLMFALVIASLLSFGSYNTVDAQPTCYFQPTNYQFVSGVYAEMYNDCIFDMGWMARTRSDQQEMYLWVDIRVHADSIVKAHDDMSVFNGFDTGWADIGYYNGAYYTAWHYNAKLLYPLTFYQGFTGDSFNSNNYNCWANWDPINCY